MSSLTLPGGLRVSSSSSVRHEWRFAEAPRVVTAVSFRKFGFSVVGTIPIDQVR